MRQFAASKNQPRQRMNMAPQAGVWLSERLLGTNDPSICGFDFDKSLWWYLAPWDELYPCGILPQAQIGPVSG